MESILIEYQFVIKSFIAGLLASIACGLGALPLAFKKLDLNKHIGIGYGFAGGLMFAASVYNLLLPAFTLTPNSMFKFVPVLKTLAGILLGCLFLWWVGKFMTHERLDNKMFSSMGGRLGTLVFIAMCFHSIPEGVAVGVGFTSEQHYASLEGLGLYVALAIGIHNIPEGLAVALPMRAAGASIPRCFFYAFLTSLPQPLAAIPASLLVWFFEPLMLPMFGFAAGSMMYLVIVELIPEGLEHQTRSQIAWSFMLGFCLMVLVQVAL